VICCGRRFGKDVMCINIGIESLVLHALPVGWFQPTYKSLLDVWRAMKAYCKPATKSVSEQNKRLELVNGGIIEFWSLDGDPEACRGRKYKDVIINEAAKSRHLMVAWRMAIRPALADYRGRAWFPSTPRGRDDYHGLWRKGQPEDETYDPDWKSWQMPTRSNPHIAPSEIESLRKDLSTAEFHQEIEAGFLDRQGRFFDEFEEEHRFPVWDEERGHFTYHAEPWHVIASLPLHIGLWCNWWGTVDYGTSATSPTFYFALLVQDHLGDIYAVDEIYDAGKGDDEQAQLILECLEKWGLASPVRDREGRWELSRWQGPDEKSRGGFESLPMDWASTFPPEDASTPRRAGVGKYAAEVYWERGLPAVKGDKDRKAGWRTVKRFLHATRTEIRSDGEEYALPRFRILATCKHLIRVLNSLDEDAIDREEIEQAPKQEDHPADALRMGLHRSIQPPPKSPEQLDEKLAYDRNRPSWLKGKTKGARIN